MRLYFSEFFPSFFCVPPQKPLLSLSSSIYSNQIFKHTFSYSPLPRSAFFLEVVLLNSHPILDPLSLISSSTLIYSSNSDGQMHMFSIELMHLFLPPSILHQMIQFFLNQMILKGLQRPIHLLSFTRHPSRVLLLDDKTCLTDYDVIISDIDSTDLSGEISKKLGKKNLSPLSKDEQEFQRIRCGILFGRHNRGIVSLPTRFKNKQPVWIHYLVDTGSPWTFLSKESIEYLTNSKTHNPSDLFVLKINGLKHEGGISKPHFQEINLLGMDFLKTKRYVVQGQEKVVSIQFKDKV